MVKTELSFNSREFILKFQFSDYDPCRFLTQTRRVDSDQDHWQSETSSAWAANSATPIPRLRGQSPTSGFPFIRLAAAVQHAIMLEVQRAQSGSTIILETIDLESRPGDRDAGGSGTAGTWMPRNPAGKGTHITAIYVYKTSVISHKHVYNTAVTWHMHFMYYLHDVQFLIIAFAAVLKRRRFRFDPAYPRPKSASAYALRYTWPVQCIQICTCVSTRTAWNQPGLSLILGLKLQLVQNFAPA
jgi:hypothetical protein